MNMQEITNLFKESGFIQNPHTHKWSKNNISMSNEFPTIYTTEARYCHSNIYIRKKVD